MNTAVKVALRVRPLTLQEQISNCSESISYVPNEPQIGIVGSDKSFTFDYVFDEETKQSQVYDRCSKELVDRFVEGFNATILAYGQTGSGKTYSMGTGLQYQNQDQAIVPRAAEEIFTLLNEQMDKDPAMEFQVFVSFLELYNEELIDLLQTQPRSRKETIQVREDGFGGITWAGVKEQQVGSSQEIMEWLQKGSLCRTTAATDMNQTSSRSHAIFSVILKQQRSEELEEIKEDDEGAASTAVVTTPKGGKPMKKLASKFHFVDLAGSERLKRTRAQGDRAKEGISINSGLLALGNVISALGDESRKSSHVPYRDSKLTRLLQDSLGGNSATLMVACVSGSDADLNETISTLVYANRARNIRNRVVVNHDYRDASSAEVAQLRAEINRLRMENQAFKAMGSGPAAELDQRRAAEEIRTLRGDVARLRERLRESSTELCDVLAERDTLLVEREVAGDADIEAHPIMMTYHRTVMQLKDRLIAAEDQALELQTLLSQRPNQVFGRRNTPPSRNKAPSPFKRNEPPTDDEHDADGEHEDGQRRKDSSPPRGRQVKRKSRQSSRAVSRFDFGSGASNAAMEPAQLPTSPPVPQVGGNSSWFQNLKTEESQPMSALDYSSSSSSMLKGLPVDSSDSSNEFSRRRRAARLAAGGAGDGGEKAKDDIRRGLLLLNAEKHGIGMDMDLLNLLDSSAPPVQLRPSPASSRRRDSMTSSLSSGSGSHRSRFHALPTLEDVPTHSPISPLRPAFPPGMAGMAGMAGMTGMPPGMPPGMSAGMPGWNNSGSPQEHKIFFEAEQKAAETLANAMKAMHRFSFPLSASDTQHMSQQQQQSRLAAAIQQQKAAAIALPDSDSGSVRSGSFHDHISILASMKSVPRSASETVPSMPSVPSHRSRGSGSDKHSFDNMLLEVQSGISIKEELVQQLEKAEAEYHHMRSQYEGEIRAMEGRIREAEMDRERERERSNENKLPGSVKVKYESKIKSLMSELSDLQHKYADVSKVANEKRSMAENQLRTLRVAVETLKAEKTRMIKRMKEDAERIKEMNAANDREIQALRRAEKAAQDGRKKAEREVELQLQQQARTAALLQRNSSAPNPPSKVIGFLKKPQTPKGITKAPKRVPRHGAPAERSDSKGSSIPGPKSRANPASIRLHVSQKKQVIDRAIYGYISGKHTINVMEDLLKKRERLRSEKQELEMERVRVVQAQEENAVANGTLMLDFASEPQYMDDRLNMIDAEVVYINARIKALQAEAAALGFVTTIEKNPENEDGSTTSDEEELMTRLIRQGMADDAMGLPPGSGAAQAFDSSISILRSLDLNESREFLEMIFEDMVAVRAQENSLLVQVSGQEKVIEELKRALQAMRQAAVGATLGYEKKCDGLEQKLRELSGSSHSSSLSSDGRPAVDGSSEEDELDAEVARTNCKVLFEDDMKSPILDRGTSAKDLNWTTVPDSALPRSGSVAEALLGEKAKRLSTIFDQMYDEAIKTSDESTPKVGGSGGEFSRILIANSGRRVSWAGVPNVERNGGSPQDQQQQQQQQPPQPQPQPQQSHRLSRSSSTGALAHKASVAANAGGRVSSYGHRRGGSTSSGSGSGGGQSIGSNSLNRSNSNSSRLSVDASRVVAPGRQHAEVIAARRSSTPLPSIGPKSSARPRYHPNQNMNVEAPLPSPTMNHHPRQGAAPLTIQTGFAQGHPPLRHVKSFQQPPRPNNYDQRRSSTPSPSPHKRIPRSDSDGSGFAGQTASSAARVNARPLSRMGSGGMSASPADVENRRISGHFDDGHGLSVYERLASGHTQASQARVLATRHISYGPFPLGPAGGSMMTSGANFQQIQQCPSGRATPVGHRPGGEHDQLHGVDDKNWCAQSTSSVSSDEQALEEATHQHAVSEVSVF